MYKKSDQKSRATSQRPHINKHKKSDFSVKNHRLFKVTETNGLNLLIKKLSSQKFPKWYSIIIIS